MSGCFLILAMTFERFYSIIRPHKAASFNTAKKAKIIIGCIVVFFMIFNIPRLFLGEIQGLQCLAYGKGSTILSLVYFYTEMIISFVFPFISLLFMNSVIIYTLQKRTNLLLSESEYQGHVKGRGQRHDQTSKIKSTETQITVTLLVVTFSFLILTTPAYITMMYMVFTGVGTTPKEAAIFFFLYQIGEKSYYTNYAINFFLYVISGQKFRTDLMKLFLWDKHCLK